MPIRKISLSPREIEQNRRQVEAAGLKLRPEQRDMVNAAREAFTGEAFVTAHPAMKLLKQKAMFLSNMKYKVLINGETGTGKELVARMLHGTRSMETGHIMSKLGTFYPYNCASGAVVESTLFGYVEGSYTDAKKAGSPGLLVQAEYGTVFLDEVGELDLSNQALLLRALETMTVRRVGGFTEERINCRFIFATNRDLKKEIAAGRFREDLYYRIAEVCLEIMPLRERKGDVPIIADYICKKENWPMPNGEIPEWAYDKGNVRGLRNWLLSQVIDQQFTVWLGPGNAV